MDRKVLRTRLALAIVIASILFVIVVILTGGTLRGFTLWG